MWILVDCKTKNEIKVGDTVTTFRGEIGTLVQIIPPARPNSTGRVVIKLKCLEQPQSWYPGVIDAEWKHELGRAGYGASNVDGKAHF